VDRETCPWNYFPGHSVLPGDICGMPVLLPNIFLEMIRDVSMVDFLRGDYITGTAK
jgi:hypothetical protein